MTIDKSALKKLIDSMKPCDASFSTLSSIDRNSLKEFKSELDKIFVKGTNFVVLVIKTS